jgi:predicted transcriptional regulator
MEHSRYKDNTRPARNAIDPIRSIGRSNSDMLGCGMMAVEASIFLYFINYIKKCKSLFRNHTSLGLLLLCMKNRSKTDIIGHILEAVNSGAAYYDNNNNRLTKSKIMYNVFLSYTQLQEYLSALLEKGLIEQFQNELQQGKENKEKEKEKQRSSSNYYYRITEKGRRFLQIYRELSEMMIV